MSLELGASQGYNIGPLEINRVTGDRPFPGKVRSREATMGRVKGATSRQASSSWVPWQTRLT